MRAAMPRRVGVHRRDCHGRLGLNICSSPLLDLRLINVHLGAIILELPEPGEFSGCMCDFLANASRLCSHRDWTGQHGQKCEYKKWISYVGSSPSHFIICHFSLHMFVSLIREFVFPCSWLSCSPRTLTFLGGLIMPKETVEHG